MPRIAVDIDSTLYDFSTPAREGFLKLGEQEGDPRKYFRGAYDPWQEWRSPADSCGLDVWMKVIELCHSEDIILKQVPFDGAVETCQALADEGHELMYISNRATESESSTDWWLRDKGFPLGGKHTLVCMMEDKKPYLKDCQYLIDDRPKTCVEFVYDSAWFNEVMNAWVNHTNDPYHLTAPEWEYKYRRRAFVLAYPYNQNLTDIPNLYLAPTWAGLNYYMVSKGVLSEPAHVAMGV